MENHELTTSTSNALLWFSCLYARLMAEALFGDIRHVSPWWIP